MLKLLHVVGTRPNFMKAAPVIRAVDAVGGLKQLLVHTGQHYDKLMSDVFFEQLGLRFPDFSLGVGGGSHAQQLAQMMIELEPIMLDEKPDMLVVYGDVNSTLAASLVASKINIPIGHVESGLRSFDRSMPEEVNRVLVDRIADYLFVPSEDGVINLGNEGAEGEICLVGNVMIDTLKYLWPLVERSAKEKALPQRYALVTLHRPSNVDDKAVLKRWLRAFRELAENISILFPMHPRTANNIRRFGLTDLLEPIETLPPQSYVDFVGMVSRATVVVTDSGGVQEETSYLGIPCLTLRENTERPITIKEGTNQLVGMDMTVFRNECQKILDGDVKHNGEIPLWDGRASERIAEIIATQSAKEA